jgi:hypothetical protein
MTDRDYLEVNGIRENKLAPSRRCAVLQDAVGHA